MNRTMRALMGSAFAITAVTLGATVAAAAAGPINIEGLDHYLCYQAKTSKADTTPFFGAPGVPFLDQTVGLIPGRGTTQAYNVGKVANICVPTSKQRVTGNGSPLGSLFPIVDPDLHLMDYGAKLAAGTKVPAGTAFRVQSQFFDDDVDLGGEKFVMVRASKVLYNAPIRKPPCAPGEVPNALSGTCLPADPIAAIPPAPANGEGTANFVCYAAKQRAKRPTLQVLLQDQFSDAITNPVGPLLYDVKKMTRLCMPADKNEENPGAETSANHLACFQVKPATKSADGTPFLGGKPPKFKDGQAGSSTVNFGTEILAVKGQKEICIPAYKSTLATEDGVPLLTTKFVTESRASGGDCGDIKPGPVPGCADLVDPLTAPHGPGDWLVCGSLRFGGGLGALGSTFILNPNQEAVSGAGSKTRYAFSGTCYDRGGGTQPCAIVGTAGADGNSTNGSIAGTSNVPPVSSMEASLCSVNKLGADATGTLHTGSGVMTLNATTLANIWVSTGGCPHCTNNGQPANSNCFKSGAPYPCCTGGVGDCTAAGFKGAVPAACCTGANTGSCDGEGTCTGIDTLGIGGDWGVGTCSAGANAGNPCFVKGSEPGVAGLSGDCPPPGPAAAVITISTNQSTSGDTVKSNTGNFCSAITSGAVTQDSPTDYRGCFGSGVSGGQQTCKELTVTGTPAGSLLLQQASPIIYGDVSCIPGAGGAIASTVNGSVGLPGPVATTTKTTISLRP